MLLNFIRWYICLVKNEPVYFIYIRLNKLVMLSSSELMKRVKRGIEIRVYENIQSALIRSLHGTVLFINLWGQSSTTGLWHKYKATEVGLLVNSQCFRRRQSSTDKGVMAWWPEANNPIGWSLPHPTPSQLAMLPIGLDSTVTKLLANLLTKPSVFYY